MQRKLFKLFFRHSYPSEFMSAARFRQAFTHLVFTSNASQHHSHPHPHPHHLSHHNYNYYPPHQELSKYFATFDAHFNGAISFRDFVLGLAAMEPITQHGGVPAEQRCRYIFRYYTLHSQHNNAGDRQYSADRQASSQMSPLVAKSGATNDDGLLVMDARVQVGEANSLANATMSFDQFKCVQKLICIQVNTKNQHSIYIQSSFRRHLDAESKKWRPSECRRVLDGRRSAQFVQVSSIKAYKSFNSKCKSSRKPISSLLD